jgi:hypothetical protein
MRRLAESGVTVILKADHERFAESGDYWTLVFTGGRLAAMGPEWAWAADFVPGL